MVGTQQRNTVMDRKASSGEDYRHYLLVEDNLSDQEIIRSVFDGFKQKLFDVKLVQNYTDLITELNCNQYDSVILDMNLPDRTGPSMIKDIGLSHPDLPVVVLTGHDDYELAITSLEEGAQDFLSKNRLSPELLERSLRYAIKQKNTESKLKASLRETERKNTILETIARHDTLTELPNRKYFVETAERVLSRADRLNKQVALLYFDLNGFKKINDTYGHQAGDELLKEVAKRVNEIVRTSDMLARIGGDEFVIITDIIESKKEIYHFIKRILAQFNDVFVLGGHEVHCVPSIGIAFYPDAKDLDELIKQADAAMYEAKRSPEMLTSFYTDVMAAHYSRSQKIEMELKYALEHEEMKAWYQPVINVRQPDELNLEALARWHSPLLGWVMPNEFIPVAEHSPVINSLSYEVLKDIKQLYKQSEWEVGASLNKLAINVCATQLTKSNFADMLLNWMDELAIPRESISIELTERQLVQNASECRKQLSKLREEGVQVALDDYGTGYSSITHLLDFPIDILKVDRKLITGLKNNTRNQALLSGILEMAHKLDMKVVAEGIEDQGEFDTAVALGCDYLQGFHISKPLPHDEVLLYYALKNVTH